MNNSSSFVIFLDAFKNKIDESGRKNDWWVLGSQEWLKNEAIKNKLWCFSGLGSSKGASEVKQFSFTMSFRV